MLYFIANPKNCNYAHYHAS